MMSSYNKLAKQRMLSSIELCTNDLTKIIKRTKPITDVNMQKKCNGVRKIKHCDQETTDYTKM